MMLEDVWIWVWRGHNLIQLQQSCGMNLIFSKQCLWTVHNFLKFEGFLCDCRPSFDYNFRRSVTADHHSTTNFPRRVICFFMLLGKGNSRKCRIKFNGTAHLPCFSHWVKLWPPRTTWSKAAVQRWSKKHVPTLKRLPHLTTNWECRYVET